MTRHNVVRYSCDGVAAALMFWVVFWLYPQTNNGPAYGWAAIKDLVTHPFDPNVWFVCLMLMSIISCAGIFTDWYIRQTDVLIAVWATSGFAGLWAANELGYNIDHFFPGAIVVAAATAITVAVWGFVLRPHPKG